MANTDLRYLILRGGSSAGKTVAVVQNIILSMLESGDNTIVFRKYSSDIQDSIFSDFRWFITENNLSNYFVIQQHKVICTLNNSFVRFRGLDDPEKVKGISGFRRVVLEEATQLTYNDFKQIRKKLRGKEGQQIILIFNPISEEHWIKKKLLDNEQWTNLYLGDRDRRLNSEFAFKKQNKGKNITYYKVTYRDNYFVVGHPDGIHGYIDQHTIDDFEYDRVHDEMMYLVYANGEWGMFSSGNEFYWAFNKLKIVKKQTYDPDKTLHISIDENVLPYLPLTIWQMNCHGNRHTVRAIDELCMEPPMNSLSHLATAFKKSYPNHRGAVIIYGDATSMKRDVKIEQGYNLFKLLDDKIRDIYKTKLRVPPKNPNPMVRGMYMNEIFSGYRDTHVEIDPKCKNLIADYRYTKENEDGAKLKQRIKSDLGDYTYEPYGHTSDTGDYFICEAFKKDYYKFATSNRTHKRVSIATGQKLHY